ncbi:MAG: hypothetical protein HKN25_06990 [Pyrinomonadaceae bacterium]|nr:hypothetical protein [Pyrinomonadaceae bacterium]
MATYHDPVKCFAPLEVLERILEIREEFGFTPAIYVPSSVELADYLDAYGFDSYVVSQYKEINYGDYRSPLVPGGDSVRTSLTAH